MVVNAQLFHVYLYDPAGTQETVSPQVRIVSDKEGIYTALRDDDAGIGIDASTGKPELIFYEGEEKADRFRVDYAYSSLQPLVDYHAEAVGSNNPSSYQPPSRIPDKHILQRWLL